MCMWRALADLSDSNTNQTARKGWSQTGQDVPHTPSTKTNSDWNDLLDGPQGGHFAFGMWDENSFNPSREVSKAALQPEPER